MRTPNKVAYRTKACALMAATLTLWLIVFALAVYYGAPTTAGSEVPEGLSGLFRSIPGGYAWGCIVLFAASILASWFCGAQDRLEESSTRSNQRRASKL
ncbi:hypothetical protein PsAD2_02451 [Pseudovibrio axinellae]|uniref:Uncharacterized protein n=1 Tax=Pseudovibrio axinellae TaxID=989403 RepID=A0A165YKY2_9HYPH|nr:hypothetical protein [Pseudovibrio axinellae]KZL18935.1 hypothetical protein PsAD2_02451 [Pseudovibrio axinellae]SEP87128.1 hypothetical protein SAMN05421798_101590 [Pseudovibrio axinellae]